VDLLRGFEKISSWREGSSPVKGDGRSVTPGREEGGGGGGGVFGKELRKTNGDGVECVDGEDGDSQMTEVKMESQGSGVR
jgi:hypothetical protein